MKPASSRIRDVFPGMGLPEKGMKIEGFVTMESGLKEGTPAPTLSSLSHGLRTEVVRDFEGLTWLKQAWDEMAKRAEARHPYISHAWISTWLECFGKGLSPYILVVKDKDRLKGIAPLALSRERLQGIPFRRLGTLYNPNTGRCDFIAQPGDNGFYHAVWEHFRQNRHEWDMLELSHLPLSSQALQTISRLAQGSGFRTGTWEGWNTPYVPTGNWERYYAELPRKHKSNLRNRHKRLGRLGQIEVEEISSVGEIEEGLADGFQIEAAAWKGEGGTAIKSDPAVRDFYTRLAGRAATQGWLRLYFLTLDRRRIAFAYCFRYQGGFYLHKVGYDPAFHAYSPVNQLCLYLIEASFSQGLREFDFVGEKDEWKLRWTSECRPHRWLYVFSQSWTGRLLYGIKFQIIPWLKRHRFRSHVSLSEKQK